MSEDYMLRNRDIPYVTGAGYQWTPGSPTPAVGVTVTSGTTPAFGSWAAIIPATEEDIFIVGMAQGLVTDPVTGAVDITMMMVEIGLGAAGAEFGIHQYYSRYADVFVNSGMDMLRSTFFPFPLAVKAGSRVSVRFATSQTSFASAFSVGWIYAKDLKLLP